MEQGLKIKIGAETIEVRKSLDDLQSQLKRFQTSLKTATDPRSIERLNKAILRTNQYIGGIKTAGLRDLPVQANNATTSLTNLGRIASDLPFGFVAISNNLDPLFQSFGQLRKETGSTKEAFKQLGSSLLGGGGIALAFSVITAAITYFSMESSKAKSKAKELKEEIKSVADVRGEAAASVQGEIANVKALTASVLDESKAKSERLNAIQQLKKINKSYFGDLSLESSKLATLTEDTKKYTEALIQAAVVKGFEQEISKVSTELFKQEQALDGVVKKYGQLETAAKGAALSSAPSATNFSGSNFGGTGQLIDLNKGTSELNDQIKVVSDLRIQYKQLTDGINDATQKVIKLNPLDGGGSGGGSKSSVDALKAQIDSLENIKSQIGLLKSEELQLLDLKIQLELRDQDKNKLTGDQLRRLVDQLIVDADLEANPVTAPIAFKPTVGKIQGTGTDNSAVLQELTKSGKAAGDAVNEALSQERLLSVATAINDVVTPSFMGLFDTLVSGSGNALQAVGQFLKDILKKLAAAVIQAAIFAGIMTALGAGPAGASFGSLFKGNLMGGFGIKGSAGNMSGRGNALNQMAVMDVRIEGSDLYLSQQRYQKNLNRIG